MHIPIDVFRMWILVKIYKLAFTALDEQGEKGSRTYVFLMLLFQAKYKFVGVLFNFNDIIMQVFALVGIYFHLKQNRLASILFMGCAASIKMSAILYLPGALLVQAFEYGVF